jgi:hypothetical protein
MNHDCDTVPEATPGATAHEARPRNKWPSKLTREQKEYIVGRLAEYGSPTEIALEVRRQFGVKLSRQSIVQYDPTRVTRCGKEWGDLFVARRKAYAAEKADRAGKLRRTERLVLRTVELLAERILKGVDAEGRAMFTKPPEEISDEDRLAALLVFIDRLKTANPDGYTAIRIALSEEPQHVD